jgi:AcrR family transcriptional regulator
MAAASGTRRTQQERRETTRNALLEATIQSLVEQGYAGTTTRAVSARAGVSPGALQHHFASKQELVAEAIGYLSRQLTAELIEHGVPSASSRHQLTEQMVDQLWQTLNGPLIVVAMELAVAARTDPFLRERFATVQRQALDGVPLAVQLMLPEQAARPEFIGLIHTVLAAMRGVVLLGFLSPADQEENWLAVRPHLLALAEGSQG